MKKLIILGYGGTCFDLADIALGNSDYELFGFLDDQTTTTAKNYPPVLGKLEDAGKFPDAVFVFGIGSPTSYTKKAAILEKTQLAPDRFVNLIHPQAFISPSAKLGRGVVILAHTSIGAQSQIADHVILLQNSVVGHESQVGSFSTISAGVTLSGRVHIGSHCYLGAGSAVKENIAIGDNSLVGLGSSVISPIPMGETWAGTPARKIRSN